MARVFSRRSWQAFLIVLSLFLLGTIAFLWAVRSYFSIDASAIIRPEELGTWEEIQLGAPESSLSWKARYPWLAKALSIKPQETAALDAEKQLEFDDAIARHAAEAARAAGFGDDGGIGYIPTGRDNSPKEWNPITDPEEKIPRIIHQTWKDATLPPQWQAVRDECARMHPDYKYMLWTDHDSRVFLEQNYPWFIPIFDAYPYPIQRADAIRYFILHYYGGIYMDLDVGCLRRFDPLLRFEVVLPKTIPVGVSNDVMASAAGHPFMDHLIHNLVTFNHRYLTHYPTVMFSTGPMFVSASYGLYVDANGSANPSTPSDPKAGFSGIRVLPKPLYGKNAKPSEAPDSFFRHFYGSSWHANDAGFLIFLRDHGRLLIFVGFCVVVYGFGRSFLTRLVFALGDRQGRRRRHSSRSRRGHWISLPFIRDPVSGRYRSVSQDVYEKYPKRFSDEGTQTGSPPSTVLANEEEGISLSTKPSRTWVAAPQPQRAGLPLFNLGDSDNSNGEEDIDLGPGLNEERRRGSAGGSTSGILSWMNLSRSGSSGSSASRPQSSASLAMTSSVASSSTMNGNTTDQPIEGRTRADSRDQSRFKPNGVLYLPAFLVGSNGSSASTDSGMASVRTSDEESSQSPTDGSTYSTGGLRSPPWSSQGRLHARSSSNMPGSAYGNWASFSNSPSTPSFGQVASGSSGPNEGHEGGQGAAGALQKMLGGIHLGVRTPSPSMMAQAASSGSSSSQDPESLMSSGKGRSASDIDCAADDAVPPPPYESADRTSAGSNLDGSNEATPTLSAMRKLGR